MRAYAYPLPEGTDFAHSQGRLIPTAVDNDSRHAVMAGLVPAIYVFDATKKDVDARDKRGHDA
jgi:hypothetical protein